ncbi:MAG: hypothetical protein A3J79_04635 [Elusimicrobia bacterium RIFOXYB2_FULL_62_6]|nr:MAG: hypothetical protein A3J79_04635 [Elusimicrobia bacterium RIFOXYB2_FULL_62_6]
MKTVHILLQVLFAAAFAPLVSGVIRKIKNSVRMRTGAPVLQPYYNLFKLLGKEEVRSVHSSWILAAAPYVVFASTVAAVFFTPILCGGPVFGEAGDFLVIIFLFSLGRFFQALAGLDAAGAFGGMGSSREMFLSALVEPAVLVAALTVSLNAGTTDAAAISGGVLRSSACLGAAAMLLAAMAETSRIPVDNQETHLELTMVHEAMVLEYSGRALALIELAAHIKQLVFFSIIASLMLPCGAGAGLYGAGGYLAKLLVISLIIALTEISLAKMRLFRAVDFLGFALVLALAGAVMSAAGF